MFSILIACLLDIVLILQGEILSWSLMGEKGFKEEVKRWRYKLSTQNYVHKFLEQLLFKNTYWIRIPFLFSSKGWWTRHWHFTSKKKFRSCYCAKVKQSSHCTYVQSSFSLHKFRLYLFNGKRKDAQIANFLKTGVYIHINHNHYDLLKCDWWSNFFIFRELFCRVVIGQCDWTVGCHRTPVIG